MSRSYRHTPTFRLGGGKSEKYYKRLHSKSERVKVRGAISHGDFLLLHFQQVRWEEWSTARDGKIDDWENRDDKKTMSK